ncbi:MAG TPA: hypothetical protein VNP96_00510 [Solirubrobacterales bacterium]|nr:hypothetical protein [Solirubrobacterales bacterium]
MQILASALPGFRDLRAPVIAGYMWMLLVWLLVDPNLDRPPENGITGSIYDLMERIGPIWIAIAAGVVAYLSGSVSQEISRILKAAWQVLGPKGFLAGGFNVRGDERLDMSFNRGRSAIDSSTLPDVVKRKLADGLRRRAEEAQFEATRELDLPATLLVGDQAQLFAEVDRLRAEGELRMAVVPPLLGLMAFLAWDTSLLWLGLTPVIVVLFVQGIQKDLDSRKSIADAIWLGRIKSSSVAKFSTWVDEVLPAEIERIARSRDSGWQTESA